MTQQNAPPPGSPPGGPPHHHHAHILDAAAAGTNQSFEVDPQDLNIPQVADFLNGQLPGRISEATGRPEAAPTDDPRPPEVKTPPQAIAELCLEVSDGFLKTPRTLPRAVGRVGAYYMLMEEIDPSALKINLPFNSVQVRAGGFAMLKVLLKGDRAKFFKVEPVDLGRDLAQAERIDTMLGVIRPIYETLLANESQVLRRIASKVDTGLLNGMSMIKGDGSLLREMAPALAIKQGPVDAGLVTRGQNVRTEAQIRADEQAKLADQGAGDPHKGGTTTTVTTEVPPTPAPATPKTQGGKKKGQ